MSAAPQRCVTSIVEYGGRGESGGVRSTETWGMNESNEFVQKNPLSEHHLRRLRLAGISGWAVRAERWLGDPMSHGELVLLASMALLFVGLATVWSGLHHHAKPTRTMHASRLPLIAAVGGSLLVFAVSGWLVPSMVVGAIAAGWSTRSAADIKARTPASNAPTHSPRGSRTFATCCDPAISRSERSARPPKPARHPSARMCGRCSPVCRPASRPRSRSAASPTT